MFKMNPGVSELPDPAGQWLKAGRLSVLPVKNS